MTEAARGPITVIGIGNPDRGDDAIGPLVIRRLAGRVSDRVGLLERAGDALALLDDWSGCDTTILIDAAAPLTVPGTAHRIDLRAEVLTMAMAPPSTHAFGVAEAVALADTFGLLPERAIAFAVEGECFDLGAPVSPRVAAALDAVVEQILTELRHLEQEPRGGAADA